jgi:hypothetical protein
MYASAYFKPKGGPLSWATHSSPLGSATTMRRVRERLHVLII